MSKRVIRISFLAEWGKTQEWSKEPLQLNQCSIIEDRGKFFDSHITLLLRGKDKKDKRKLRPYYDRLVEFYKLVRSETDEKAKNTKHD